MSSEALNLSPCIGRCRLGADDNCCGCYRHVSEIRYWGLLAPEEQRKILVRVAQRRHLISPDPDISHD